MARKPTGAAAGKALATTGPTKALAKTPVKQPPAKAAKKQPAKKAAATVATRKPTPKTVSFYEIVKHDGPPHRMEQADWQQALTALASAPLTARRVTTPLGDDLIGTVVTVDEKYHLVLAKVRDDVPQKIDFQSGDIEELEQLANGGYVETTVISFLAFGNCIGLVRGATSAPSQSMLESFVNQTHMASVVIHVRPVISRDTATKLKRADEASRIEVKAGTSAAPSLEKRGAKGVSAILNVAREVYGDVSVEFKITARADKKHQSEREKILEDARVIGEDTSDTATARARLVYVEDDTHSRREKVDFVEQAITAKRVVAMTGKDGVLRNVAAVEAITMAAAEHEAELRRALDAAEV